MRGGFRIFDTPTHLGTAGHSGRSATSADLLRVMDAQRVDRSLLIPFPVVDDYRREHDSRKFPDLVLVVAHCGGGIFVHEAILAATFCSDIVLEMSSLMPHQMIGSDLPQNGTGCRVFGGP